MDDDDSDIAAFFAFIQFGRESKRYSDFHLTTENPSFISAQRQISSKHDEWLKFGQSDDRRNHTKKGVLSRDLLSTSCS